MAEGFAGAMPEPESSDLGRYLEDTITIDWQTPAVMEQAKDLLEGVSEGAEQVERLFRFVRDEISHSQDVLEGAESPARTCRASEVLKERTGLCYAKSHLLAGLLRIAGYPTGFCYVRLVDPDRPGWFVLHGFNGVYWPPDKSWIYLDARGNREGVATECRFESPWSLAFPPNADAGEGFLPFIYRRPAKRIIDLLERAPDFDAIVRNLPDSI
jgi:transglutaminase-like putative cysteine protease